MSRKPDTGCARVRKKHCIVGSKLAKCRGQEFRTDRLYPRSLLDIVLQLFVEGLRASDLPRQKLSIRLFTHGWQQCTDCRLDVANETQIQRCATADVLWVLVDLNLFHIGAGKKF